MPSSTGKPQSSYREQHGRSQRYIRAVIAIRRRLFQQLTVPGSSYDNPILIDVEDNLAQQVDIFLDNLSESTTPRSSPPPYPLHFSTPEPIVVDESGYEADQEE